MSASVESWSWQGFFCLCVCVSDLVFVRGRCVLWMFVVASAKCSVCQSVFFNRHDCEVATHPSCSAKSSHFVRNTGARVEGWHDLLTSTMVPTKSSSA